MKITSLHEWDFTPKDAIALQRSLAKRRSFEAGPETGNVSLVAGADISSERHGNKLFASVVVMTFPDLEPVESVNISGEASFPYIPGLLSFREMPLLLKAFEKIKNSPDAVLIDGQGIAHPRGLGIATHIGLFLGIPTIGCAKTVLFGTYDMPCETRGSSSPLVDLGGLTIGAALRTRTRVSPVFVSVGNKADLDSCVDLVLACAPRYRLPEPSRQAHIQANKQRSVSRLAP